MSKNFLTAFLVGIAAIAILVTAILYLNRGARIGLTGQILKVRTAPLDENSSIAVLDFRVRPDRRSLMETNVWRSVVTPHCVLTGFDFRDCGSLARVPK